MPSNDSVTLDALAELYYEPGDGTRKGPSYLSSYMRLLAPRRQQPLRILELGVASGASLLSWHDYLPNAIIVGVDLADAPPRIVGRDRLHFLRGSQDDPAILDQAAVTAGGSFDLIVDDASHIGYLTKRSLLYLFPRWLVPGGCYVIEDFGSGFLRDFPDGQDFVAPDHTDAVVGAVEFRSSQHGMVGVVKQLIEPLMQELMIGTRPYLAVERLTFETNIVFIEKSVQPGGPPPIPSSVAVPEPPPVDTATDNMQIIAQTVLQHGERLARAEAILLQLLRALGPLRWLRRSARGMIRR